jgi:hypothetical protein
MFAADISIPAQQGRQQESQRHDYQPGQRNPE